MVPDDILRDCNIIVTTRSLCLEHIQHVKVNAGNLVCADTTGRDVPLADKFSVGICFHEPVKVASSGFSTYARSFAILGD